MSESSPTPNTTGMAGGVSFALARVSRAHHARAVSLLRPLGLHPSQEIVMMQLWTKGPQRQVDLATTLGSDAATIARTVQRLERGGFVRRTPDPDDGRASLVAATPVSMGLRDQVTAAWDELENNTVAGLSPDEQTMLTELLQRVLANLS